MSENLSIDYSKYETVVGLEIHAQLSTNTKAFSAEHYAYGGKPNSQLSPITLAHPGTLPKPNVKALEYAIRMGLSLQCQVSLTSAYSRKNYFYPDLPKAYQITQFVHPICTEGVLTVATEDGGTKDIGIEKIILEEDSGKSQHDIDPFASLIDLNRAGVPLIEIVSKPDIRTPAEASDFLNQIRQLVQYLDICDGNMEEGSLRCDANISIRPKGDPKLYTRVEVKNINSVRFVAKAIAYETKRQIELVEGGGVVTPDTRGYDAGTDTTYGMRSKELANDYRYFPDPDIPPIVITEDYISGIKQAMPELPKQLRQRLQTELGLSEYDANIISSDRDFAHYFLHTLAVNNLAKPIANWLIGPVRSYLNSQGLDIQRFPLSHQQVAALAELVNSGGVSFSMASQQLFPALLQAGKDADPKALAAQLNLLMDSNEDELKAIIEGVLKSMPEKVAEYKSGKNGLMGLFMGQVMKATQGKADPKLASKLLLEFLD